MNWVNDHQLIEWFAFQVLNGNPYNRKCDVYSFGICLWEIYCCDMPYPDLSFSEVTSAVVRQVCLYFIKNFFLFNFELVATLEFVNVHLKWIIHFLFSISHHMTEFKTRDTQMLPKFSSKCDEAMLGCKSWPTTRNGWGCFHAGGHRHIKRWRYDSSWSTSRLSLLPKVPRPLNISPHLNILIVLHWDNIRDKRKTIQDNKPKEGKIVWT